MKSYEKRRHGPGEVRRLRSRVAKGQGGRKIRELGGAERAMPLKKLHHLGPDDPFAGPLGKFLQVSHGQISSSCS